MSFGGGFPTSPIPAGATGATGPAGPPGIANVTATAATPGAVTAAGLVMYRKPDNNAELTDGDGAHLEQTIGVTDGPAVGSVVMLVLPPSFVAVPGLSPGVVYVAGDSGALVPEGTPMTGPSTRKIGVGETSGGFAGLRLGFGSVVPS